MLVYENTKAGFLQDASDGIEDKIRAAVFDKLGRQTSESEYISWRNSLGNAMYHTLATDRIPDDASVAIEYQIPRTRNRIDFIIAGEDESGTEHVVIIELKQWTETTRTDRDAILQTRFRQGLSDEPHPSYQAWSYAALLRGFNQTVYEENIDLRPCAYLHNHAPEGAPMDPFYAEHLERAPAFCKGDKEKLQDFIARFVRHGSRRGTLYRIDRSAIRPSKSLAESVASMLRGNEEFVMIDEQKVIYEKALELARIANPDHKRVLIVRGGPGTGKSVVAINLLVALTKLGLNAQYTTKNAAPRAVFESKLTGTMKKTAISNLFTGSGSFIGTPANTFDALIVDEAHRLGEKSGMFRNLGENQIKEIIEASKCAIFFLDEDQKVTWQDIGERDEILRWAERAGAEVTELELASQFRCNGSDGYLAWLDSTLGIRETANPTLDGIDYDFRVVDSPSELRDLILAKNKESNRARLVAGYCWDWVSKKDPTANDITFPGTDFSMKWNLATDRMPWIISPESVREVGCIHTCQGLEVDYVGVIIGPDLIARDGRVCTDPAARARTDASLKGYKTSATSDPNAARRKADAIIRNTYRTLMTRGMKGCYVYCVDEELRTLLKEHGLRCE